MQFTPAQTRRGLEAMMDWVRRNGTTGAGQPLWSDEEVEALRVSWPDVDEAQRRLPKRNRPSIEAKALKLDLPRRKRNHLWTSTEVARVIRMWPIATRQELLEAFPWAIWEDLQNQMQHQRRIGRTTAHRPKAPFKPTGHLPTDAVLEEARRSNLSLREVDMIAETPRYFSSGRHRRRVQWRHLGKTIEALGGEVQVDWDGEA